METELLQTQDYLLFIDEETICKTGELYLTSIQNRIIPKSKGVIQAGDKILAYYPLTKEAKELDLPLLPNPFEKEIDEDINIKAEKYAWRVRNDFSIALPANELVKSSKRDFIAGYKSAQAKGQYSLEDMKKAIEMARDVYWDIDNRGFSSNTEGDWSYKYTEEEIIQSLSTQQLPKEFILGEGVTIEEQIKNGYYE